MRKYARTTRTMLCLTVLVACGRGGPEEPTPRADLVGVWDLATVNGAALPTLSPDEDNVMLETAVLTLEAGGHYSLATTYHLTGQPPAQNDIGGAWAATDQAIRFEGQEGPALLHFGYSRDGDRLTMVDDQGNQWGLRRR